MVWSCVEGKFVEERLGHKKEQLGEALEYEPKNEHNCVGLPYAVMEICCLHIRWPYVVLRP